MSEINKKNNLVARKRRVRATVKGTSERPRLSVFASNVHISAQIIDDSLGKTLAAATTVGKKITTTKTAAAQALGAEIAKAAKKAKISQVVFDRNGRKYTGRIKALAEAAREEGLKF